MYVMGEYLKYTKKVGGVAHWAEQSDKKSSLLYGTIDSSNGFYNCPVEKTARPVHCRNVMTIQMNVLLQFRDVI
jgi:phosphoserine aminotransferase